jgi:hypothetical protein
VLLKQGLVLFPPSLGQTWKTASIRKRVKTRGFNEGECCKDKALSLNPKRWMALGVDNLGLGRHPPFNL